MKSRNALWMSTCLIVLASFTAACGNAPTAPTPAPTPAPIAAANLVTPSGAVLALPGCQALANLNAFVGSPITTCSSFSAPLLNTGPGCAGNVHGTLTVSNSNGQQIGSASWSYPNSVRSGEQFVITGGRLDVPTSLVFNAQPTATWDNIRCS